MESTQVLLRDWARLIAITRTRTAGKGAIQGAVRGWSVDEFLAADEPTGRFGCGGALGRPGGRRSGRSDGACALDPENQRPDWIVRNECAPTGWRRDVRGSPRDADAGGVPWRGRSEVNGWRTGNDEMTTM